MEEQAAEWPDALYEIVWYQHNPDDWVAEVVDCQTGEHRKIMSADELVRFVQPRPHLEMSRPVQPKRGC